MATASKTKKSVSVQHKKRQGLHQRRTDSFMKTYWPYIPMLGIIGLGLVINLLWTPHAGQLDLASRNVSRVQLLTNNSPPWGWMAVSAISGTAIVLFAARHIRKWQKVLVHGEEFVLHNPLLDFVLLGVAMSGFVLVQSAGIIH